MKVSQFGVMVQSGISFRKRLKIQQYIINKLNKYN